MEEEDQLHFGFDLLDPTKIVPEDIVPFTPLGKMTLNRNPRNYFAETEQVMVRFSSHPSHGGDTRCVQNSRLWQAYHAA
jgi:catalase